MEKIITRFWSKIDKSKGNDSCWMWLRGKDRGGYGKAYDGKKSIKAHRFAFILANGEIKPGYLVRHKCDNPSCCNPRHLLEGTAADNAADRESRNKGTQPRGEGHGASKITEEIVRKIRKSPATAVELSKEFCISARQVRDIRKRIWWKHVV